MNNKVRDALFLLMCFTLIFNIVPKPLQMPFIGGPLGTKLVFYPVVLGMLYTLYCQCKYGNIIIEFDKVKKYVAIYLGVTMLSLIVGLYTYPYYDLILAGPKDQIEKLPKVLAFLNGHGIDVTYKQLLSLWMLGRPVKGLILDVFYSIGTAYMIFCWYIRDWRRGFDICALSVLGAMVPICIYNVLEIGYLLGNNSATDVLKVITPYCHQLNINGTWHPPLLWPNQMRSLFAEPSHFGMYLAFCLPFLWYKALNSSKRKMYIILTILMIFFLFLTKARTAFMLHVGELGIFFLLVCCLHQKKLWKKIIVITCCSFVAFICSNMFMSTYMNSKTSVNKSVDWTSVSTSMLNYIDSNAASLVNPDKRSNRARYLIMEADFKIGLSHPLLGVGKGLRNAYIPDYFSEKAFQDSEVKMWFRFREKLGLMKFSFPMLGEYTGRFAETGLLGLIIFLHLRF